MKVFLDYKHNDSGKGKFLKRLIPAMDKIGVQFDNKEAGCSAALGISRWRTKTDLPKVLRVDGVHLIENDKNNWKNERIRKGIKRSNAVIYQSEFAKREVIKKFGLKSHKCYVVFNGANPDDYDVEPVDTGFKRNIIASAKWCHRNGLRKHKGLKETIRLFTEMSAKTTETGFFILGRVPDEYESTARVRFLGHLEEPMLRRYLKTADEMYYLASYDWCPNAVVEAIVAGVKVHFNPKCEVAKEFMAAKPEDFYIDNIAMQYKRVFDEVV